jgi:hypothetical protein
VGNVSIKYQIFRYEDMARDPASFASSMYRFVGLLRPESLGKMIDEHINKPTDRKEDPYTTYRSSSTVALNAWKEELTAEQIGIVENSCRKVLSALGEKFVVAQ